MDNKNLPLQIKMFNERVRALNQTSGKILTLNATEARGLHAEIYDLLATIAGLTAQINSGPAITTIGMDGGGFK
jgi:hypothetical protein